MNSQISSNNLNGHIKNTESYIKVSTLRITVDYETAWALCNILRDTQLKKRLDCCEKDQLHGLSSLGAAIGQLIDHSSKKNVGDKINQID